MQQFDLLLKQFAKLPGLGPRSARRIVLYLLKHREQYYRPLIDLLQIAYEKIHVCQQCGNLSEELLCSICQDVKRVPSVICVVENIDDLWAIERVGSYRGRYHVLGGVLSALDGVGPEQLRIYSLIKRIKEIKDSKQDVEVILALNATVEGHTTMHYLNDLLKPYEATLTCLAHGVPIGGELDYLDEGTISAALQERRSLPEL